MNPDKQSVCAANPERCYFGSSPSLAELKIATSSKLTQAWLVVQLDNVLSSLGKKDEVDQITLNGIAQDVMFNYSWLNTSEFMLFCSRVKVGKYGQLAYGSVTVNDVVSKIPKFLCERESEIKLYTRLQEQQELDTECERRQKRSVSQEEGMRIVNAAADGDVKARARLYNNPENWECRMYIIEWANVDKETKERIIAYFGIHKNHISKKLTACFANDRYAKFLEGEQKGFYTIVNK